MIVGIFALWAVTAGTIVYDDVRFSTQDDCMQAASLVSGLLPSESLVICRDTRTGAVVSRHIR